MLQFPSEVMSITEFSKLIGHNFGDKWEDVDEDGKKHNVILTVVPNTNNVGYIYYDIELTPEEELEYTTGSVKIGIDMSLSDAVKCQKDERIVNAIVDKMLKCKAEGAAELKTFIKKMRKKYHLHPNTDYCGDKLYVMIPNVIPDSAYDAYSSEVSKCTCSCEKKE